MKYNFEIRYIIGYRRHIHLNFSLFLWVTLYVVKCTYLLSSLVLRCRLWNQAQIRHLICESVFNWEIGICTFPQGVRISFVTAAATSMYFVFVIYYLHITDTIVEGMLFNKLLLLWLLVRRTAGQQTIGVEQISGVPCLKNRKWRATLARILCTFLTFRILPFFRKTGSFLSWDQ